SSTQENLFSRFLYYFFSVLCNYCQRTLSLLVRPSFRAKADAKVRLFSETPNIFAIFFQKTTKKVRQVDLGQPDDGGTPYYII
ncbi:MAG: hypothetical protein IJV09_01390, partial [Prevotella sp.]|nr:hypothetical protein [Prevotella sp.]